MARKGRVRSVIPGTVLLLALLPFAVPVGLALILLVASDGPRQIAPGSGLKLAGFASTVLTALAAWVWSLRVAPEPAGRRIAALLCLLTGLIAWPVWTLAVLLLVNGLALRETAFVAMTLERTETTTISRSRALNHWAWLRPIEANAPIAAGRCFIPEAVHDLWTVAPPERVEAEVATGLMGARTVVALR